MHRIKVWCPHHTQLAAGKKDAGRMAISSYGVRRPPPPGCAWEGSYGDLVAKHLKTGCQFHKLPCPLGCGAQITCAGMEPHEAACDFRPVFCPLGCGAEMRSADSEQHKSKECPLLKPVPRDSLAAVWARFNRGECEAGEVLAVCGLTTNGELKKKLTNWQGRGDVVLLAALLGVTFKDEKPVAKDRLAAAWVSFSMGRDSAAPIAALCGLPLDKKLQRKLVMLDQDGADVDQVAKALGVLFES